MNKEFIPYKQALALKELGFDENCLSHYVKGHEYKDWTFYSGGGTFFATDYPEHIKAPLYQQAFRWFREEYGFIGVPTISNYSDDRYVFDIFQKFNDEIYFEGSDLTDRKSGNKEYNTFEEAELACLKKLIEVVKKKDDES